MKKLFLFAACLVFIISSFLLVANAAEPAFGTLSGEGYKDTIPQCHIFGEESNGSLTHRDGWFNESCAKVLLTYTVNGVERTETYPAYYILENDSTLIWNFSRLEACLEETHGADVELSIESVVQIQIPYGITVIPERAFVDSSRWDGTISEENPYGHATESNTLTYVYMPNTVLEIGDFAFAHCTGLDRFDANDAVATGDHNHQMLQSIGYRAFHGCPLTSFIFNNHLVSLGEGCFEGCSIKEINLSRCSELKEIPARAFHEAEEESTSIILSNSIERIGDHAFTGVHASMIFLGTSLK